ncbi:MAG: ubiquitin-like small modifier protein 1 [Methanosarcinales archaeon]
MVKVRFSSALQNITKTRETNLEIGPTTIKGVLNKLTESYGEEFAKRILDGENVRRFVNLYLNGEDIRHLEGVNTPVKENDEISILPAVSGG